MSIYIDRYRNRLREIIEFGGSLNETTIRRSFIELVNDYAKDKNLVLIEELEFVTEKGNTVYPDGTLKSRFRLTLGYYEAKDPDDNLEEEIEDKKNKNYPFTNIIFENSINAVLFQNNKRVLSIKMENDKSLQEMLESFINFEREEIKEFNLAVNQFKTEIPKLSLWCKEEITIANNINKKFTDGVKKLLSQLKREVNPDFLSEDIHEIIVQHILTNRLFKAIFSETEFHLENNIAHQIDEVVKSFFTREKKKEFEEKNKHLYSVLERTGILITDHHDKQDFLKTLYEEFYKSYNPKEADRLGVVYTPNEIVEFMIKSTDELLDKHFNTGLAEKNVKILDPATGTGTFIADLIDYIPANKLEHKYLNEIFANEIGILPYYVANLNIEYTYSQKMKVYKEFPNLCFMDTLDNSEFKSNIGTKGKNKGQYNFLDMLSEENSKRMAEQNNSKISVVIGNPPYNANQKNYNDKNANRSYFKIDGRIKETFKKESTASKNKLEDMYARFYRWAMDRIDEKSGGIISFITNRSFIDAIGYDGFRKIVSREFDYIYIIDTKSDIRDNNKLSGTKHNVFGIQTGVAIMFLIKTPNDTQEKAIIKYHALIVVDLKEAKLAFFKNNELKNINWDRIYPNKNSNWIETGEDDFDDMIPIISKNKQEKTIFNHYTLGVSTNRDEWVYDFNNKTLVNKMKYFTEVYNKCVESRVESPKIKWSSDLKNKFSKSKKSTFSEDKIINTIYRPFVKKRHYSLSMFNDRLTDNHFRIFGTNLNLENEVFHFSGIGHNKTFSTLAYNSLFSLDSIEKGQSVSLKVYSEDGIEISNVSDWALNKFRKDYKDNSISKDSIYYYSLATLFNPKYRNKYKQNLCLDFPRIPMYKDFWAWSGWGKKIQAIQSNFETAIKYKIKRIETGKKTLNLKPQFKIDKLNGIIYLDSDTRIENIPKNVFEFVLGIRSGIEWILDQYKIKKIIDKTIAENFNNYNYADHKEQIIELIQKVITVSLDTLKIMEEMNKNDKHL